MARSAYTYVVILDGRPVAGFTVRHELVDWLSRQGDGVLDLAVWRCGDGLNQKPPVELDVNELVQVMSR